MSIFKRLIRQSLLLNDSIEYFDSIILGKAILRKIKSKNKRHLQEIAQRYKKEHKNLTEGCVFDRKLSAKCRGSKILMFSSESSEFLDKIFSSTHWPLRIIIA
jgi:hypothetical protein